MIPLSHFTDDFLLPVHFLRHLDLRLKMTRIRMASSTVYMHYSLRRGKHVLPHLSFQDDVKCVSLSTFTHNHFILLKLYLWVGKNGSVCSKGKGQWWSSRIDVLTTQGLKQTKQLEQKFQMVYTGALRVILHMVTFLYLVLLLS